MLPEGRQGFPPPSPPPVALGPRHPVAGTRPAANRETTVNRETTATAGTTANRETTAIDEKKDTEHP
jgi:hypothetical protein